MQAGLNPSDDTAPLGFRARVYGNKTYSHKPLKRTRKYPFLAHDRRANWKLVFRERLIRQFSVLYLS